MNNLTQHIDPLPRVSEDVLCLYIAHCYKILHLRYTTIKVSKGAKIGNLYNQVPHLTQDTNGKVTSCIYVEYALPI